eukprot:UN13223
MDAVKRRLQRIQDLKNGLRTNKLSSTNQKATPLKEVMTLNKLLQKYKEIKMDPGLDIISQEKDICCM